MDAFPISSELIGKSASAYEHLRHAVSEGQLRPGRRLSAPGLAAAFRISETPVREALARLSAEGFLLREAGRGYFIKPVTLEEQRDLHEMLRLHLPSVLRRPEVAWPDLLTRLERLAPEGGLKPADAAGADDRLAAQLGEVGTALAAASGNTVLRAILPILLDRTRLIRRPDLDSPARIAAVGQGVITLTEAVRVGDPEAAAALIEAHLVVRLHRLSDLVGAANQIMARATYP